MHYFGHSHFPYKVYFILGVLARARAGLALEVRIWEPGTSHQRKWVWEEGWQGQQVTVKWDTRWYNANGPYAHPGEYPLSITVGDAWGRKTGLSGQMVVPAVQPTATPTPTPTATAQPTTAAPGPLVVPTSTATPQASSAGESPNHGTGGILPQAPQPMPGQGNPGPVIVPAGSQTRVLSSPPARSPTSHLPLWGSKEPSP